MPTITCPQCHGFCEFEGAPCDLCAGDGKVTVTLYTNAPGKVRPITHALENRLYDQISHARLPLPEREYRFHPTRKWRFDFAWPAHLLAAEIEGGIWLPPDDPQGRRSRHTVGSGFERDCEKYNAALLLGWRVLRFTPSHVRTGYALNTLAIALKSREQK
jgi:hypothetical protein